MAAMKGKGPGDKVARLGKKAEKAVAKVEKAAVKGALKIADKARKRASTIGATDMLTRGIGGPIGTEVGSFAQASKQKKLKRK